MKSRPSVCLTSTCLFPGCDAGERSCEVKTEADHTEHSHDEKPTLCLFTVCDETSSSDDRQGLAEEYFYSCTLCDKGFSSQGALCNHLNIHRLGMSCFIIVALAVSELLCFKNSNNE